MSFTKIESICRIAVDQAEIGHERAARWNRFIGGSATAEGLLLINFQVNYPNRDDKTAAHNYFMERFSYDLTDEECVTGSTIGLETIKGIVAARQVIPVSDLMPLDTAHHPAFISYLAKRV